MVNIKQYGMLQSASFSSAKSVQTVIWSTHDIIQAHMSHKSTVNAAAEEEAEGSAVAAVVHFAVLWQ